MYVPQKNLKILTNINYARYVKNKLLQNMKLISIIFHEYKSSIGISLKSHVT